MKKQDWIKDVVAISRSYKDKNHFTKLYQDHWIYFDQIKIIPTSAQILKEIGFTYMGIVFFLMLNVNI